MANTRNTTTEQKCVLIQVPTKRQGPEPGKHKDAGMKSQKHMTGRRNREKVKHEGRTDYLTKRGGRPGLQYTAGDSLMEQ